MEVKYNRDAAIKLRDELNLYAEQINNLVKEVETDLLTKDFWSDDKRKQFNAHIQTIKDNLTVMYKSQSEFVATYSKKIEEWEQP